DLLGAIQGGAVGQVAPGHPFHMGQQLVHMAAHAAVVAEHDATEDDQAEHAPHHPGNDGQLLQGVAEITGAAGNLDQSLDLPGSIEQRQEVGKQTAPGDPAESLLTLPGSTDAVGNGGAGQVSLGNAGGGDAVAVNVKHRGTVYLAQHKHRPQGQFHCLHVALVQRVTHWNADGTTDQLQIVLQALFLELPRLAQPETDAQGGKQHDGQHHEQQQGSLQTVYTTPLGINAECVHF